MSTKKIISGLFGLVAFVFFATPGFGQSGVPEGILFQALARDPSGIPAKGRVIHIKDMIVQSAATGTVVLSETFTVEASDEGVFTITIGKGTKLSGANKLSDIDWAAGPYFLNIKAAIEPSILTPEWKVDEQYVDMGTSQFWTVPFAFRAASVSGMELLLKSADTTSMLSPYLRKSDTASLSSRIERSLQISDTAGMLSSYINKHDTAAFNNLAGGYLKKNDTTVFNNLASGYLKKNDTTAFNNLVSNYFKKSDTTINALTAGKLNTSDTAAMLSSYLRKADLPVGGVNNVAAVDTFSTNLVVYAANGLGKYGPGQTIPSKGKTAAQVLMDVIMQTIPPSYVQPTVSLGSTPAAGNVEIGSALNIVLSALFTQNDAGAKTSESFSKNGSAMANNMDNIPSLTSVVSYTATVNYAQGGVKNNNTGASDETGRVAAGSKTSSPVSFTPQAKRYWGYASSATPTDAEIRAALGGSSELSSSKAKTSFDITISGGSNYIFYAYPAAFGPLSTLSVGGFGSLPAFTLTTRAFTNANGYTQSYNIYLNQNAFSTPVSNIIIN
jgi:hypothetical protein